MQLTLSGKIYYDYDVTLIQKTQSGVADEMVLEMSVSSATVLLTSDGDFGRLNFQKGHIFYRLPKSNRKRERSAYS
ncbi:hypothetical protein GCM10027341_51570 [Spirosoma knui]